MQPYVTPDPLGSKTAAWLESILPFNQHEMTLNTAASALLVVDMQNFFLDPASPTFTCGGIAILPSVKRLLETFRQAKRPVIFTRHVHMPRHERQDEWCEELSGFGKFRPLADQMLRSVARFS